MAIASSPESITPLRIGTGIPNGTLLTMDGKETNLYKAQGVNALIIIFYRGHWCRFCTSQLAEMHAILPSLRQRRYNVIGISPDLPENLQKVHTEHKLDFPLFSDTTMQLADKFGLAYRVDDATHAVYMEQHHIDIEAASGEKHHILPVPAVYIADSRGAIKFAYSNPDHTTRVSHETILERAT